ncbi:MAG: EAL domain-containing protein [Lachnospiraceae bacterium]|nr:EAL domain-containing protein [Lachnospiraceae bacterium]
MNIQIQCCGLFVLVIILYFYLRQKSVGLKTEQFFKWMLVITCVSLSLDVLSVLAIVNRTALPGLLVEAVCKAYITTLVWAPCFGLLYVCTDLFSGKKYQRLIIIYSALAVVGTVLIIISKIEYFHEDREVYTHGQSINYTYVFAFFYVVCIVYMVLHYEERINPRRRQAVLAWMAVWFAASLIQLFHRELLVIGFASALGMMILFFELENPEAYIDKGTGAFNLHTLHEYIWQLYQRKETFSMLAIYLEPDQDSNVDVGQLDGAMLSMVDYLEKTKGAKVFKNVERELIVLYENAEQLKDAFENISKRFSSVWNEYSNVHKPVKVIPFYILMPDSHVAENAEDIFDLMRYYRMKEIDLSAERMIQIDQSLAEERRERKKIERMIVHALEEDRMEVFLQPIYSTEKKSFVSAEALVRLQTRRGEYLPPAKFIPVAEESGLIARIGERVFDKTCEFIKKYDIEQYGIKYVEVNLSARQCESPELPEIYKSIMEKHKLNPGCINLEVTESVGIQRKEQVVKNMQSLIDYGVTFSLDDFGNGQSNLNYIVDMPVHIVKFDKDMTQAYFNNEKARFVLEAAIHMIHGMKLEMVSEGVETEEQLQGMTKLGIQYIQGYYFSRPLQMSEFLEFVKEWNLGDR